MNISFSLPFPLFLPLSLFLPPSLPLSLPPPLSLSSSLITLLVNEGSPHARTHTRTHTHTHTRTHTQAPLCGSAKALYECNVRSLSTLLSTAVGTTVPCLHRFRGAFPSTWLAGPDDAAAFRAWYTHRWIRFTADASTRSRVKRVNDATALVNDSGAQ